MFVAACWLLVKRTFEAGFFVWNCVCLFCLFVLFVFVWLWCMTYGNSIVFFLIFCLHLAFSSIQIEKCFGNCLKRAAKKWDLLLLIDLIWVEDILILGYTKIFVISYIPGSKPPNILYWISKGTFEIFKLSGLVITEKKKWKLKCEMKMNFFYSFS